MQPPPAAAAAAAVPLSLHIAQQRWLGCWVWWLLVHLVLPLLRNNFYVTESEPYRQQVFFYRCVGVGGGEERGRRATTASPVYNT
jgi:hypothetical protein